MLRKSYKPRLKICLSMANVAGSLCTVRPLMAGAGRRVTRPGRAMEINIHSYRTQLGAYWHPRIPGCLPTIVRPNAKIPVSIQLFVDYFVGNSNARPGSADSWAAKFAGLVASHCACSIAIYGKKCHVQQPRSRTPT